MAQNLHGAAIVIHGGGPTPVLNASLSGMITEARNHRQITALYGAKHGVQGVLNEQFWDLLAQPDHVVRGLRNTPGSAIGSSRMRVREEHYPQMLEVFARHDIRFAFVAGGNGTQDTGLRLERAARAQGYELRVVGIPKTVDNDLGVTLFSPGYPTAARFFAQVFRDVGEDNRSLPTPINVIEVIGRNVGWVVGATALARWREDDPPHLIYLPERRISEDQLCADVERVYRKLGRCVVAMCEGQLNDKGKPFGASFHATPGARDQLAANLAHQVATLLTERLGVRARSEKPGLLGRASALDVVDLDRRASYLCGQHALLGAIAGLTGSMVTIERFDAATGQITMGAASFERVALTEHALTPEHILEAGNGVTEAFLEYVRPLTGPIEPHVRLYP
jgi:6-phosphofructokinase 1